jgi:hypothetical protein
MATERWRAAILKVPPRGPMAPMDIPLFPPEPTDDFGRSYYLKAEDYGEEDKIRFDGNSGAMFKSGSPVLPTIEDPDDPDYYYQENLFSGSLPVYMPAPVVKPEYRLGFGMENISKMNIEESEELRNTFEPHLYAERDFIPSSLPPGVLDNPFSYSKHIRPKVKREPLEGVPENSFPDEEEEQELNIFTDPNAAVIPEPPPSSSYVKIYDRFSGSGLSMSFVRGESALTRHFRQHGYGTDDQADFDFDTVSGDPGSGS